MKHILLVLALCCPALAQTTAVIGFSDLQNWWPMEDGSGSTVTARVGANNGTITGATWAPGILGGCLSFNGTSQYATFSTSFQPAVTQPWSMSCWFYPTHSFGQIQEIVEHAGTLGEHGYQMAIETNGKFKCRLNSSGGNFSEGTCATVMSLNAWHFGVVTWDGSNTATAYLDTLAGSNTSTGGPVGAITYSGNFSVGRYENGATLYYGGKVDDLKCYYHKMTQGEVNYLFYARRQQVQ